MEKVIYFRFDIDTISCISDGIDPLLRLAHELDLRFTFFVNMGKSISRREIFLRSPKRTLGNVMPKHVVKVSALSKLGVAAAVKTVLFNPDVGKRHLDVLDRILKAGHELGLHGGDNHSTWQRNADHWSSQQIADAMDATHDFFARRFGKPVGFASPGGTSSPLVYAHLKQLGYRYVSDSQLSDARPFDESCGLLHIPVNVHVDDVPVLESLTAQGLRDDELQARALALLTASQLATTVGHPCFEGKSALPALTSLCRSLKARGYEFLPYRALAMPA